MTPECVDVDALSTESMAPFASGLSDIGWQQCERVPVDLFIYSAESERLEAKLVREAAQLDSSNNVITKQVGALS